MTTYSHFQISYFTKFGASVNQVSVEFDHPENITWNQVCELHSEIKTWVAETIAEPHTAKYSYEGCKVSRITLGEFDSNLWKGMPTDYVTYVPETPAEEPAETTEEPTEEPTEEEREPTQEETETAAQAELSEVREELHRIASTRSAWARGVLAYADELLDSLSETIAWEHEAPANAKLLLKALLNGADDWEMYSFGGCSLIYDRDIAERLCTPSELRKTDHGRKLPNQRETWIAVQARALYQASALVREAYRITRARKEVA